MRVARAQRWAGHALFVTGFGSVILVAALVLVVAELRALSFAPFALLVLGLASLLAAAALGVFALLVRGGTNAPEVVGRAALAIGLGTFALLLALVIALGLSGFS